MANDLAAALNAAAAKPQSVSVDGQSMTNRPLGEQLEVTKFLMATRARTLSPLAGVTLTKLKPHGSVTNSET